jgi:hypothetical protein
MVKGTLPGAALVAAITISGTALAQDVPASAQSPDPSTSSGLPRAESTGEAQMRARQRVATMEAVLERAVSFGADRVIEQVRDIMGGDQPRLLGAPRVRGTRLEGYGVFFDVEVPRLNLPILWDVRYLVDGAGPMNAMLAELRLVAAQLNDPASRALLESTIARLQAQTAPPNTERLRQNVTAASISPEEPRTPPRPAVRPAIEDPQAEYRKQVTAALIDAVLENTAPVLIGPEEWLWISARSNVVRDPLYPGDTVGSTTWVARVKGSTLADLRAQRITLGEARTLVVEQEQ